MLGFSAIAQSSLLVDWKAHSVEMYNYSHLCIFLQALVVGWVPKVPRCPSMWPNKLSRGSRTRETGTRAPPSSDTRRTQLKTRIGWTPPTKRECIHLCVCVCVCVRVYVCVYVCVLQYDLPPSQMRAQRKPWDTRNLLKSIEYMWGVSMPQISRPGLMSLRVTFGDKQFCCIWGVLCQLIPVHGVRSTSIQWFWKLLP